MEPSEVSLFGWESRQLLPLLGFPLMPASARVLEPKSPLRPKLQVPHWRPTLCAHASSVRSRPKPERSRVVQTGLHRTAGHPPLRLPPVTPCHPEPDRLLKHGTTEKQKPLLRDTGFRLGCRNMVGLVALPCALTKPAPSIRVRFALPVLLSASTPTGARIIGQSFEWCKWVRVKKPAEAGWVTPPVLQVAIHTCPDS
jgi:hypothetical protein